MAQLVVRNIEESVKARLQRRAEHNGHSMEEEVREILRKAVNEPHSSKRGLGSEIAALFSENGIDFDISELRGYTINPPNLED